MRNHIIMSFIIAASNAINAEDVPVESSANAAKLTSDPRVYEIETREETESTKAGVIHRNSTVFRLRSDSNTTDATGALSKEWRDLLVFTEQDQLFGWAPAGSGKWRVENEELVGTNKGTKEKSGVISTVETFRDFELEVEFHLSETGTFNSGVFLRNAPATYMRTGYQINIGRGVVTEYCGALTGC